MQKRKPPAARSKDERYWLYERAVQSPQPHAELLANMYEQLGTGRPARRLREDFCGTFAISCEWVKLDPANTAVSLDLDPEPLDYGKRNHWSALSAEQKSRVKPLRKNVLQTQGMPKVDLIAGCNFSFFIFKDRATLVKYFRACRQSLKPGGALILEMAGGPGMIEKIRERKYRATGDGTRFTYTWDQKSFDPITHDAKYGIHFRLANGRQIRDAFTYDWRLWTIPEVRDALLDAGFSRTGVFWETEHEGEPTGEYILSETADNAFAWVSQVAGVR